MELKQIEPLLKKKPWARLVNAESDIPLMTDIQYYDIPTLDQFGGLRHQFLSNADLLNESCESARLVNSRMFSQRPISEIVTREIEVVNENGEKVKKQVKESVVVGYDEVETVRSGLPEMIIKQHASHLGKNGIEIADEWGKDRDAFCNLRAWKDISGIDSGFLEAIYHAGKQGDCLLYQYQQGKKIQYSVYSLLNGNMIFPHKDDNGNPFYVRLYKLKGRDTVDIYFTDKIETWVRGDISTEKDDESTSARSWFNAVKGWFKRLSIRVSEDGWTRLRSDINQIDNQTNQVAYLRFDDSFIGCAMQNINAFDRSLSYTSDKMRSTAYSKFMVKATKIKSLPALSSGEEVIGIDGDVESLKASDAKYIAPPDVSNIATINNKNVYDAIMQSCMSIDLQPEILKSGADSSQTLKLLLRRELQWCHVMWPQVRPFAAHVIQVLKSLVGKIESEGERYDKLKISVWNTPWLPQDEDATANRVQQLTFASILSQESSRQEMNLQYTGEAEQIKKEQEDKIYRETYIRLKAEADARKDFGINNTANDVVVNKIEDNPSKKEYIPKVDNNAPNKP